MRCCMWCHTAKAISDVHAGTRPHGGWCLQLLAFEAFRDLVRTAGQSEAAGLAAAQEENLRLRASARSAANDSVGLTAARRAAPVASPATPAGAALRASVGLSDQVRLRASPVAASVSPLPGKMAGVTRPTPAGAAAAWPCDTVMLLQTRTAALLGVATT